MLNTNTIDQTSPTTMPLKSKFAFWIFFTKDNYIMKASEYEQNLKKLTDIDNAATFWSIYQHIRPPSQLPANCELFFFKEHIKPVWENKHNRGGGKFIIRARKEFLDKIWEKLLVEVLFWDHLQFCGIDLNVKRNEISIWTKELEHHSEKEEIKGWIRKMLGIDEKVYVEFKEHPLTEDITPLEKDWEHLLQLAKSNAYQNI